MCERLLSRGLSPKLSELALILVAPRDTCRTSGGETAVALLANQPVRPVRDPPVQRRLKIKHAVWSVDFLLPS
jgi:hypothetical protein